MLKHSIIAIILIFVATFSFGQQKLFNGKDLQGWKVHGTEKWYVENGELVCESGPDKQYGYLVSEKDFKNFELKVEFKQESNGNSGVFFHSSIEGTTITGWQAEIAPKDKHRAYDTNFYPNGLDQVFIPRDYGGGDTED